MSSETTIKLSIPRVPPSYSKIIRMKVNERIKLTTTWRIEVMAAMHEVEGPNAMIGSLANYKMGFKNITILQYRKTLIRDKDNLVASVKPILDALTHNALIADDDMKHIKLQDVFQSRAAGESLIKTEIIISDP